MLINDIISNNKTSLSENFLPTKNIFSQKLSFNQKINDFNHKNSSKQKHLQPKPFFHSSRTSLPPSALRPQLFLMRRSGPLGLGQQPQWQVLPHQQRLQRSLPERRTVHSPARGGRLQSEPEEVPAERRRRPVQPQCGQ